MPPKMCLHPIWMQLLQLLAHPGSNGLWMMQEDGIKGGFAEVMPRRKSSCWGQVTSNPVERLGEGLCTRVSSERVTRNSPNWAGSRPASGTLTDGNWRPNLPWAPTPPRLEAEQREAAASSSVKGRWQQVTPTGISTPGRRVSCAL